MAFVLLTGAALRANGQAQPAPPVHQAVLPVITADFSVPATPLDLTASRWVRRCQAVFEDTLANHPDEGSQFSAVAIAAGRQCLQQLGNADDAAAADWPFLLRFAIALNEDALAQRIVARQLGAVGTGVRDRAAVLEHAVALLAHNAWPESYASRDDAPDHPTPAHTLLARQYAAQLDTMHPAAQLVTTRLRVFDEIVGLADTTWNADTALAREQHRLQIAQSVPLAQLPPDDHPVVQGAIATGIYRIAELEYFATPVHANLTKFVVTRDSLRGAGNGATVDSLLGHPAPRLDGDYWFNTPENKPVVAPAPGKLSLLVFGPDVGDVEKIQQLHTRYPHLEIVLIEVTTGAFAGQDLRNDPDEEAALIAHHLTKELHLPGIVCVLRTRYHTEPGLTAVPYSSPILDRFHLDPLTYSGHILLVDTEGWVVQLLPVLDDHLLPRLATR